MKSTRNFALQLLIGVLVFGFFGCERATEQVGKFVGLSRTREISVTPILLWTDTGVDLKDGQTVEITAKGEVFVNEKMASSPAGLTAPDTSPIRKLILRGYNLTPEAEHGALIGRIGKEGEPFRVGNTLALKAESPGRLYLGINDKDYQNNTGVYKVKIELK